MHNTKSPKRPFLSGPFHLKQSSQSVILLALIVYSFFLIYLSLLRITDNAIWGDEGYTIALSKMTLTNMFTATAADVHPPLYYLIVQLICRFFGFNIISYRIASIIPHILLILFSLTVVRKKWGNVSTVLFISFASWLDNAIVYNLEIRMYSWAAFFVLLSYTFFHDVITENKTSAYIGFVISSLCAAYTHYYALISVAFFYAALMIVALVQRKKYMRKTLLTWGITIVAYLPWFFVLIASYIRTTKYFWIESAPSLYESLVFFFSGYTNANIFLLFFLFALVAYSIHVFFRPTLKNESYGISFHINMPTVNHEYFWILSGILSILGTIVTGIAVSKLVYPIFITRYLYPVATVAWLLFSIACSKLKGRHLYALVVLLLLVSGGTKNYQENVQKEKKMNTSLQKVLEATADISMQDSLIFTDVSHIAWTISQYYYPNVPIVQISNVDELTNDHPQTKLWLICRNTLDAEQILTLKERSIDIQTVAEHDFLGEEYICVYRLQYLTAPAEDVLKLSAY